MVIIPWLVAFLAGDKGLRACVDLPQVVEEIPPGNTSWFWARFDPEHGIKARTNHLCMIHTISNSVVRAMFSWGTLPKPTSWRLCGSPMGGCSYYSHSPLPGRWLIMLVASMVGHPLCMFAFAYIFHRVMNLLYFHSCYFVQWGATVYRKERRYHK